MSQIVLFSSKRSRFRQFQAKYSVLLRKCPKSSYFVKRSRFRQFQAKYSVLLRKCPKSSYFVKRSRFRQFLAKYSVLLLKCTKIVLVRQKVVDLDSFLAKYSVLLRKCPKSSYFVKRSRLDSFWQSTAYYCGNVQNRLISSKGVDLDSSGKVQRITAEMSKIVLFRQKESI